MAKYGEVIVTALFALFALGGIYLSLRLPLGTPLEPMPGFVPLVTCIFLLCVSLVQLVVSVFNADRQFDKVGEEWKRSAYVIAGLIAYSLALDHAGYIIATAALSLLIMRILEPKSWLEPVIVSLGITVFSYVLFDRVLNVNLPEGPLSVLLH